MMELRRRWRGSGTSLGAVGDDGGGCAGVATATGRTTVTMSFGAPACAQHRAKKRCMVSGEGGAPPVPYGCTSAAQCASNAGGRALAIVDGEREGAVYSRPYFRAQER